MRVLTTGAGDRAALACAVADTSRLTVVSFCAAWCDACNEFRVAYERLAAGRADVTFVWLDIEDDAVLAGDVDVENFPTLAVYRGAEPLHFGVSLPHATTIGRLIDALATRSGTLRAAPEAVRSLPSRLSAG